jgi:hypothetical protein
MNKNPCAFEECLSAFYSRNLRNYFLRSFHGRLRTKRDENVSRKGAKVAKFFSFGFAQDKPLRLGVLCVSYLQKSSHGRGRTTMNENLIRLPITAYYFHRSVR